MKRLLVGIAASVFAAGAMAADLPARVYTKAPVAPPVVYNWTGFYVGGNVGYGWGRENDNGLLTGTSSAQVVSAATGRPFGAPVVSALPTLPIFGRSNLNGVIGGGQAGYNWQAQNWLVGLEADFQGSGERSDGALCTAAGCPPGSLLAATSYKLDWFGTARGRVGLLATPQLLLYATGGLAYGHFSADAPTIPLSWGDTRAGWTAGAGAEWAFNGNWSVKLEYLYMDLGNVGGTTSATTATTAFGVPVRFNTVTTVSTTASFNTHFIDNLVRVGLNYHFGGPVVAKY
jgi:outer membrane immunogenic protein